MIFGITLKIIPFVFEKDFVVSFFSPLLLTFRPFVCRLEQEKPASNEQLRTCIPVGQVRLVYEQMRTGVLSEQNPFLGMFQLFPIPETTKYLFVLFSKSMTVCVIEFLKRTAEVRSTRTTEN